MSQTHELPYKKINDGNYHENGNHCDTQSESHFLDSTSSLKIFSASSPRTAESGTFALKKDESDDDDRGNNIGKQKYIFHELDYTLTRKFMSKQSRI